ncbi:MAG TPA: type I glyceraldehyde-3-phosphate dehydrogenase, partial [Desulfovibrio sp.]|nr:type I glyceraldehyde-3-phosphate dehydrogenase [Desulfovibrio sp.]
MAVKVGINGFGRIGRYLVRLIHDSKDFDLVAINARTSNEDLALLFKHDSV